MRALSNLIVAWRNRPIFRQYLLWSYRFDLFLLIIATFLTIGGLLLIPYLVSNTATNAELRDTLTDFRANREALARLVREEVVTRDIGAIVVFNPQNHKIQQIRAELTDHVIDRWLRIPLPKIDVGSTDDDRKSFHNKYVELMALQLYVSRQLQSSQVRLGRAAASPIAFILILLPIGLMAFCLANVFHTRDIQFALQLRNFRFCSASCLH